MGKKPSRRRHALSWKAIALSVAAAGLALVLVPLAGSAGDHRRAFVPPALLDAAQARPDATFKVIVQGREREKSATVAAEVSEEVKTAPGRARGLKRRFAAISGVSAELTGRQIVRLAGKRRILAITEDAPVLPADEATGPPVATSAPTVSGTARDGATLTASDGTWTGALPLAYTYQWQRCDAGGGACADVSGAVGPSYALAAGDVGSTLRILVTATNVAGSASQASGASGLIGAAPPAAVSPPTISGSAIAGQTLTAASGAWSGTAPLVYAYQWRRCDAGGSACVDIAGATGPSYALAAGDVGATIAVLVTATNGADSASAASAPTAVVAPEAGPPVAVSPPAVSGSAVEGETLTATSGGWDGAQPLAYAYQWRRCDTQAVVCTDVTGAASPSFTLTGTDVGATIEVVVTATNGAGSATATSAPTAVVAAAPVPPPPPPADPPASIAAPGISGTPLDGRTLTATSGDWSGTAPLAYAYQWRSCDAAALACIDVAGATGASYTLAASDIGSTIRVVVTATNGAGSASATSAPTSVVTAAPPAGLSLPTISGSAAIGSNLTADHGTWAGTAPLVYAYQWRRCGAGGDPCADIAGAGTATYTVSSLDSGSTLRVSVTATNAAGTASATSAATAVVPVPPAVATAPDVSGTPGDGQTLSAAAGSWTGTAPITYSYRWQRCDPATRREAALDDAPAGYWPLDEPDGATAADASGNGRAGTYEVGVTHVAGVVGGAALFDGATGRVAVPGIANSSFASGFTLEAWVELTAPQVDAAIAGKWRWLDGGGAMLWIDGSGHYTLVAGRTVSNYLDTSVAPTPGQWEHLVGTWDGEMLRLYLNGELIGSRTYSAGVGDPTSDFVIGEYGDPGHYLNGAVDGVALYSRALAPPQVQAHYLGCRDVAGATGPSYTLAAADIGSTLRVVVTAENAAGGRSAASAPTAAVAAAPPVATAPPKVDGWPEQGGTLTATQGVWSGTAPLAYSYRWQRCDVQGLACGDIAGATEAAYVLGAGDVGSTVRAVVTAANAGGSSSAASPVSVRVASGTGYSSRQQWPYSTGVARFWASALPTPPAIAIVDSGIDADRADFAGRVVTQVTLTSLTPNSPGDGRGHGTFVASIAAGGAHGYTGAAPQANLVSLDVMDDSGKAMTSDVIAAADWIYQNKDAYNIRVANFSLQGSAQTSIQVDPVDKAVEKLWVSGVVVVAAAGNYGVAGQPSGIPYAPANDPFIITVGAEDIQGTLPTSDDVAAPWSAYGHTLDGFAKPEVAAPGRYMVAAVPSGSTLALERPESIVAPGYMQLSGTSFAAPVVAGVAADLLAAHPQWTPDQVKGALMLTAARTGAIDPLASGAGEVDASAAGDLTEPPNPNAELNAFLTPDPAGGPTPVFDSASWTAAVQADPTWGTAYWATAYWATAYWATAYWATAYWATAYWATGTTGELSSDNAYWATTNPGAGATITETNPAGGYWISAADRAAAETRLGLAPGP